MARNHVPSQPAHRIRIFVVDSSVLGTQLLVEALARDRQFTVLESASDPLDPTVLAETDVAILSANLRGNPTGGCELAKQMHGRRPQVRTLILIDDLSRDVIIEAFRAHARGVLQRDEPLRVLRKCIHSINKGQIWANHAQLGYVLQALNEPIPVRLVDAKGVTLLSAREQDVVRWVAEGFTNREIADRLGLSEHTVKNYLFRIFDKLGVSNRIELILYAMTQLSPAAGLPSSTPPASVPEEEAKLTLCRAANECCSMPPYDLAERYREGRGVPGDPATALMWYIVAEAVSAFVRERSRSAQQQMSARLNAEDIAKAEKRAAEWLKSRVGPTREPSAEPVQPRAA